MDETPVFRASKRRKIAWVRPAPELENEANEVQNRGVDPLLENNEHLQDELVEDTISNLIKARRQKSRQGVIFSNSNMANTTQISPSDAVIDPSQSEEVLQDIPSRFTSGIGHVVDIDQHMMAYIDSQMAKRNMTTPSNTSNRTGKPRHGQDQVQVQAQFSGEEDDFTDTASEGKNETELDFQAAGQRLTYTTSSKSTVPLHGQAAPPTEVSLALLPASQAGNASRPKSEGRRPRKPRLGRDGKPLRPRPRKRANSQDQARDRLVEQILSENKPMDPSKPAGADIATSSTTNNENTAAETNQPRPKAGMNPEADEQLAAEFRRQFMENAAERRVRAQTHNRAGGSGGGSGTAADSKSSHDGKKGASSAYVSEGPKLGGSRSARAKMYAARMAEKDKDKTK